MKLLVVTSLAEHADKVAEMLTRSGVKVFSRTETTGFKRLIVQIYSIVGMAVPMGSITPCSSSHLHLKRVHEICFRLLMNVIQRRKIISR